MNGEGAHQRTQIEPSADGGEPVVEKAPGADGVEEGAEHAAATEHQEGEEAGSHEGGEGAGEPGAEAGEAGEGGEGGEEAAGETGEITNAHVMQVLEGLSKRFDKLERGEVGDEEGGGDAAVEKQILIPDLTPDFITATAERLQVPEDQRALFKANLVATRSLLNTMAKNLLGHTTNQTAGYRKDQALAGMAAAKDAKGAPKFPGLQQYRGHMDEFLKDYSPAIHSRPELLERAYWYARGRNADKAISTVRKGKEVSRVIAGKTRLTPAGGGKGGGGNGGGGQPIVLSNIQKMAAKHHPGGEKGYIADLQRRSKSGSTTLEKRV